MATQASARSCMVSWATPENTPAVPGRREFFSYRNLLVEKASAGAMRAHITTSVKHMTRPTGWHYHVCESQLGYVLRGCTRVVTNSL